MDTGRASRFLSLVLRHDPGKIGLKLDLAGWADVEELLVKMAAHGTPITPAELRVIVETNDKKRFAFSPDGRSIRASQGHSINVDLALTPIPPPPQLFHGTATRFLESIRAKGILKGSRTHVHLSCEEATAAKVGARHGKPVVLTVESGTMHNDGIQFLLADNGVWLTDFVPFSYISQFNWH